MAFIRVRHNMEVAHRLYEMPGKCENIHGHSMWAELTIHGLVNTTGVLDGLEFGNVKKRFRGFLDEVFDHHLLLNEKDPWAGKVGLPDHQEPNGYLTAYKLPGLMTFPGDPTTENLARWIAKWANEEFKKSVDVTVQETAVNSAGFSIK